MRNFYKPTRKHCWICHSGNTALKSISFASYIVSTKCKASTEGETWMSKCSRGDRRCVFHCAVSEGMAGYSGDSQMTFDTGVQAADL